MNSVGRRWMNSVDRRLMSSVDRRLMSSVNRRRVNNVDRRQVISVDRHQVNSVDRHQVNSVDRRRINSVDRRLDFYAANRCLEGVDCPLRNPVALLVRALSPCCFWYSYGCTGNTRKNFIIFLNSSKTYTKSN